MERSILSWVCVFALVAVPLVGCGGESAGAGGSSGVGGSAGGAVTFTYSLLASESGDVGDLLDELRSSTLPALEDAGAQVYALFGDYVAPNDEFVDPYSEISEDQIAVLLRWRAVDEDALTTELARLTGVSVIDTSSYTPGISFDAEENTAGQGFYIQRWLTCLPEDVDEVLSLSAEIFERFGDVLDISVLGTLVEVEERDGLTRLLRIARYDDAEHWWASRVTDDPAYQALLDERSAFFAAPTLPRSGLLLER